MSGEVLHENQAASDLTDLRGLLLTTDGIDEAGMRGRAAGARGPVRRPETSSAFQSTRSNVLDTTYFFAALIVRAKGSVQSGLAPAGQRHPASIIS
jgi:hypothetical protein